LPGSVSFLKFIKQFFHCILSTSSVHFLPIQTVNQVSLLKTTVQINNLTAVGVKNFFKATRNNISGDFRVSSLLSFQDLSLHAKVTNWLNLHGYYMVLCNCQTSDMVKLGFLSHVRPFIWREDLCLMIRATPEWKADPFHFRFYPGSVACNKKGIMAPVLMINVERKKISSGLELFHQQFDGTNPLSPCGIPYLFLTLLKNQLTDSERKAIIGEINHHIGLTHIIHVYGLGNLDTQVTLKQHVRLCAPQTNHQMFVQVGKETNQESIILAFDSVDHEKVMHNLPRLSSFIRQCVMDSDYPAIFVNKDYSITPSSSASYSCAGWPT
jgi:hypothetical protein